MGKIIILMGKTASGKNFIRNKLIEEFNYKPVVTYTTRPPRPGEVDGVDYHFISEEKFMIMIRDGEFVEYKSYAVKDHNADCVWFYGSPNIDISDNDDHVIILTPKGARQYIDKYGNDICKCYLIHSNDTDRYNWAKQRGGFRLDEWNRRFVADDKDFDVNVIKDIPYLRLRNSYGSSSKLIDAIDCLSHLI